MQLCIFMNLLYAIIIGYAVEPNYNAVLVSHIKYQIITKSLIVVVFIS